MRRRRLRVLTVPVMAAMLVLSAGPAAGQTVPTTRTPNRPRTVSPDLGREKTERPCHRRSEHRARRTPPAARIHRGRLRPARGTALTEAVRFGRGRGPVLRGCRLRVVPGARTFRRRSLAAGVVRGGTHPSDTRVGGSDRLARQRQGPLHRVGSPRQPLGQREGSRRKGSRPLERDHGAVRRRRHDRGRGNDGGEPVPGQHHPDDAGHQPGSAGRR